MVNILIDGNHFTRSTFEAMPDTERINQNNILDIWIKNLYHKLQPFKGNLKRVIFAVDDRTWRSDCFDEISYKGSRKEKNDQKTDEEKEIINNFFDKYNQLKEILEKDYGFEIIQITGAEADDVIFYWSRKLNQAGENVIIVSGDSDLRQLLTFNEKAWTIIEESNINHRILCAPGWRQNIVDNKGDIFDLKNSQFDSSLETYLKKFENIVDIDPMESVLIKIVSGDSSDDIPSIYYKKTKKGFQRLGEGRAKNIYNLYLQNHGKINNNELPTEKFKTNFTKIIINVAKIEDKSFTEILSKFERNMTLIHLHSAHIPSGIIEAIRVDYENRFENLFPGVKQMERKMDKFKQTKYSSEDIDKKYNPVDDFKIDDFEI